MGGTHPTYALAILLFLAAHARTKMMTPLPCEGKNAWFALFLIPSIKEIIMATSGDNKQQGSKSASGSSSGSSGGGNKQSDTSKRGFASMDPAQQREIASEGGRAAHEKGTAHEFTSEEARRAGSQSHKNDGSRQSAASSGASSGSSAGGGRDNASMNREGNRDSGNKQSGSSGSGSGSTSGPGGTRGK